MTEAIPERKYQASLIKRLKKMFEGSEIIKTDPNYRQGFPDLLILYEGKWASLEVKGYCDAPRQPNQEFYVRKLNGMSYSTFICPENEGEVLNALQRLFWDGR